MTFNPSLTIYDLCWFITIFFAIVFAFLCYKEGERDGYRKALDILEEMQAKNQDSE